METWLPRYGRIVVELRIEPSEDRRAAAILGRMLKGRQIDLQELRRIVEGRPAIIFGAGPSLEPDLKRIMKTSLLDRCTLIAADGATTGLLKIAKRRPDIVVTDLDGRIEDILAANKISAYIVIHAHGDNIPQLEKYGGSLTKILGTTQVEPKWGLYNFGGFTDGDRAVFLTAALGGGPIALSGMDLGEVIGVYSKAEAASPRVKRLKLRICKELLEWFASTSSTELFNLTGGGEEIRGFKRISPKEFEDFLERKL